MTRKPRLLFISPIFLFPTDAGGKIRTTNILRGLKGGAFHITLMSPVLPGQAERHQAEIASVCDQFISWPGKKRGNRFKLARPLSLLSRLPAAIVADVSAEAVRRIAAAMADCDLLVIDFIHGAALVPTPFRMPAVVFTHNVEAKIFERHVSVAKNHVTGTIWRNQLTKMRRFEREQLRRFDTVIAVSEGDRAAFAKDYGIENCRTIPTGVDLDFFTFGRQPREAAPPQLVFVGSMDWRANIDAMEYFMDDVWPLVAKRRPDCQMVVVGRSPPASLVARARGLPWSFTGFVDDVRPYIREADVYVLPLRVGGGTRIKVYEAMAIGCPMVSTSIGVEGLPLTDGEHYLNADDPMAFAEKTIELLDDAQTAKALAMRAYDFVRGNFGAEVVAEVFETICRDALGAKAPHGIAASVST